MSEQLNDTGLEVKKEIDEVDMVDAVCNQLENATQREQQACQSQCHMSQ